MDRTSALAERKALKMNTKKMLGLAAEAAGIDYRAALAQQDEPVQEPVAVHQFRKQCCAAWYDGHPDHTDWGGPYEERTLYTAPPDRKPLTSDKDRPDQGTTYVEGYGYVDTRAVRAIERAHGIKE